MSRLGRNPFEKKPAPQAPKTSSEKTRLRAIDIVREIEVAPPEKSSGLRARLTEFLVVDVRARSYVFGLKAYCLSLSLFD